MLLRERAGIYSTGTVRSNHKGWDKKLMTFGDRGRKAQRGDCKLVVDRRNEIICEQWMDSKVV